MLHDWKIICFTAKASIMDGYLVSMQALNDAAEAHSCVEDSLHKKFMSRTQLLMINRLQDVLTPKVFVNCIQDKE